ncbi:hypothetical protein C8Q80DRAFT_1134915 [Daedaleopsis nitida]|nr:hypothetical protein C8Q80DRAFT_1134915 [Daedaleopsis nitida]
MSDQSASAHDVPLESQMHAISLEEQTSGSSGDNNQPVATQQSPARPKQVDCRPWPRPHNIENAREGVVFYGIYANIHMMQDLARKVYPDMVNPSQIDLLLAGLDYCREVAKAPVTLQYAYVSRNVKSWNRLVKEPVDEQVLVLCLFKYDEEEFNNRLLDEDAKKLEKALGSKATWWELMWWMDWY